MVDSPGLSSSSEEGVTLTALFSSESVIVLLLLLEHVGKGRIPRNDSMSHNTTDCRLRLLRGAALTAGETSFKSLRSSESINRAF